MNKENIPQTWLICRNLKEWHDWLEAHHDKDTMVWLQIKKAKSIENGVRIEEAVDEAICFGWIDGKMHSLNEDHYILRFTPRKAGSTWSMTNKKRAEALISNNRMSESGMEKIQEAKISGRWENAYSSKDEAEIPRDLEDALKADPIAYSNFTSWSQSQKFQAIWWLEESKQLKTRESRISTIVEYARNKQKLF
ncbi:MAG: YdeI/OmpD-associated family protein [Clostridiaceae bacterium]